MSPTTDRGPSALSGSRHAAEILAPFAAAGLLDATAVHAATAWARLAVNAPAPEVVLAAALAMRAPRHGHVAVDLATVAELDVTETGERLGLDWPEPAWWRAVLAASELVAAPGDATDPLAAAPLVLDGTRCYLTRLHRAEVLVARALRRRSERTAPNPPAAGDDARADAHADQDGPSHAPPGGHGRADALIDQDGAGPDPLDAARPATNDPTTGPTPLDPLDRLFGDDEAQRLGARTARNANLVVIAGGPGTGKTRTVARLLALWHLDAAAGRPLQVALAAPTGKAAARLDEAVAAEVAAASLDPSTADAVTAEGARTVHRLLGVRPDGTGARHGPDAPLRHDVVVVDEVSMVSLPLMAQLLSALRDETRLVLVGDPSQLASVEAGAVLADLVAPARRATPPTGARAAALARCLVVLDRSHRFDPSSGVGRLAAAVRDGDAAAAGRTLRARSTPDVTRVDADSDAARAVEQRVIEAARTVVELACDGDPLDALGASTRLAVLCATRAGAAGVDRWNRLVAVALAAGDDIDLGRPWAVGRPVLVTANDYRNELFNGDQGVVVATPQGPRVAIARGTGARLVEPSRIAAVESRWATTVHKSQGSEFDEVVLCLPPPPSRTLTRELVYTGVTRARRSVTVVAEAAAVTAAIRTPIRRHSGLADRLWGA